MNLTLNASQSKDGRTLYHFTIFDPDRGLSIGGKMSPDIEGARRSIEEQIFNVEHALKRMRRNLDAITLTTPKQGGEG